MFRLPFSRGGVTYPMRGSVYYANLVAISVLLVGSVILYAVGQGGTDVPTQVRAAGAYALPVSIYLLGALIGIIFVRRASVTVPSAAQVASRAASVVSLVTLLAAMVPYLMPEVPQGMTLPWSVFGLPIVSFALGFVYAFAWAPITGSAVDLFAREAEERRVAREAEEERAAMKASSEARAQRRAARARRAEEKRAKKAGKPAGKKKGKPGSR